MENIYFCRNILPNILGIEAESVKKFCVVRKMDTIIHINIRVNIWVTAFNGICAQ